MLKIPAFGLPAGPELLIILAILVLLFGANKLPDLARSSGQAMGEFNRGKLESVAALEAVDEDFDHLSEAEGEPEQESVVQDDNSELATGETDSKSTL